MSLEDQYRTLVGAYFGVREMDEDELHIFILKDIENYIKEFIELTPIPNFDYQKEAEIVNTNISLKRKLQDALRILPSVDAPLEFILMVQKKIRMLKDEN